MSKLVLKVVSLVAVLSMTSSLATAAILCPPTSCNIHNGCMEGCRTHAAKGVASCNEADPAAAEKEALEKGQRVAWATCAHNFFLTSKWQVQQVQEQDRCEVQASATFSCFQK